MQNGVELDGVVMEEDDGGWQWEEGLLNSCCRGRSRSYPRSSSTVLRWDWRDVLLSCCLRALSLNASQQLRVPADAREIAPEW